MISMQSVNQFIDHQLAKLREQLTVSLFNRMEGIFVNVAEIAAPLAGVIGALIALVIAVKTDSLVVFLGGFAWILCVILNYYIGSKLHNTCERTLNNNPSSITSQDYLDTVTVIWIVISGISFFSGIYFAIKLNIFLPFVICSSIALLFVYFAWLTLQPKLLTIYIEESSSAGFDAIAIMVMLNKILLRSNKILFGLLPLIGSILLLYSLFNSFADPEEIWASGISGFAGFILVLGGLSAPLVCYTAFVLGYLVLDVFRSLLGLGKHNLPKEFTELKQENDNSPGLSPDMIKKILFLLVATVVVLTVAINGKELYNDYQVKAEIRKVEDERLKLEEEAKKAAEEAEKARVDEFTSNAKKLVKKQAVDLVLNPQFNPMFRSIFGSDMSAFENYFSVSNEVVEADELVFGSGCIKDQCDDYKALAIIDPKNMRVFAVIMMEANIQYFGIQESDVPAAVKKWVMSVRQ